MKRNKNLGIFKYGFMTLAILVAISFAGLSVFNRHRSSGAEPVGRQTSLSLGQLPIALSRKVEKNYPNLVLRKNYDDTLRVGYGFPGDNFEALLPQDAGLTFAYAKPGGENETYNYLSSIVASLNSFLEQQGFGAPIDQTPAGALLMKVEFLTRSDAVCQIVAYNLLDINCTSFPGLKMAEQSLKPLVKIYEATKPAGGIPAASYPNFIKSKSASYELAEINFFSGTGQTFANFYRQAGGAWQMVNPNWYETWGNNHLTANGGTMRDCQDFDSNTVTAAVFQGQSCYDTYLGRQSTID